MEENVRGGCPHSLNKVVDISATILAYLVFGQLRHLCRGQGKDLKLGLVWW